MFDVLDILMPDPPARHTEILPTPTAFGPADDWTYRGVRLGHVGLASDVRGAPAVWTGSPREARWSVLRAADAANRAAESDESWAVFLQGVVLVLARQRVWQVTCESDCDQHPRERLKISPDDLARRLDSRRRSRSFPIAFVASRP